MKVTRKISIHKIIFLFSSHLFEDGLCFEIYNYVLKRLSLQFACGIDVSKTKFVRAHNDPLAHHSTECSELRYPEAILNVIFQTFL